MSGRLFELLLSNSFIVCYIHFTGDRFMKLPLIFFVLVQLSVIRSYAGDCFDDRDSKVKSVCSEFPVVYQQKSPGQAMDKCLQRNRKVAEEMCGSSHVVIKEGPAEVSFIYDPRISFVYAQIVGIQVKERFTCQPW
jgi:hypothetical protein